MDEEIMNEEEFSQETPTETTEEKSTLHNVIHVQSMFNNYFIDYASYCILDRAIPDILDGLKPVQRRIFHSMYELEDGRYNKVANIIGNTMKYHPHGDMSIGDAIVNLGQKQLMIDTQGNWGSTLTGDSAAASRYIEARLSKFALEVAFNPKTTAWKMSYDGRNKEPIALPVKFPLLLTQGVEGIAVGLTTKILPHNFIELIDASIAILKNQPFEIFPDFPSGGTIDVAKYNKGMRGGKIRNRAKISIVDKKTLMITEIPFGTTTSALLANSIAPAIEKGKLKIKKIDDNTAEKIEIVLHLQPNVSPDQTIDALYAFTNCEMSYSPTACVIHERKPHFLSVDEILRINTNNTLNLLKRELEIEKEELENDWHRWSLEKIFFEKKIYKELEKDTVTWEDQVENIEKAFIPYLPLFKREITREDVLKLCEKPVRKISKFDIKKADEQIAQIEENIVEAQNHLDNLVIFTIRYFENLKKKYGEGRERKTEIKSFENIVAATVAVANQKLYVNKKEGFAGINLKRDENVEFVSDCSPIDEVIVFREDGSFMVSKVSDKQFFGKNIIHIEVFKRNDDRHIYNMIYSDGVKAVAYVKRFAIGGVTRDKAYDLTKGNEHSKVLYLTSNPNGEAEIVKVQLREKAKVRKPKFEFDFSSLAIKGRASQGNILSRHPVKEVKMVQKGISTLSAINVYFDSTVIRLNNEERGTWLGSFKSDDKVITVYQSGTYRITGFDTSTHIEADYEAVEKYNPKKNITVVYHNLEDDKVYVKRFIPDVIDKITDMVTQTERYKVLFVSYSYLPRVEVIYYLKDKKNKEKTEINCAEFVETMSVKARGKRLNLGTITHINPLEPLPFEEDIVEESPEIEIAENETSEEENIIEIDESNAVVIDVTTPIEDDKKEQPDDMPPPVADDKGQFSLF